MLKKLAKVGIVAVALAVAMPGMAMFRRDPGVIIQRAMNSPIITLKINESRARVVELVVGGRSVATRTISQTNGELELQFHVDLSDLDEGRNAVEARLFDENGTLVGVEKSFITVDAALDVPVEIVFPKQGQTLQGLVEIKVGIKQAFDKPYVSFMIDGEWKAIRNFDPFTYIWDTENAKNGWHELQVWVVGSDNVTIRSRKVRVFVNNPGGRTERVMPKVEPVKTTPIEALPPTAIVPTAVLGTVAKPSLPKVSGVTTASVPTGVRSLTPTGKRVVAPKAPAMKPEIKPTLKPVLPKVTGTKPVVSAEVSKPVVAPKVTPTVSAGSKVMLAQGTKLPKLASVSISLNNQVVSFPDVQPYIAKGVALTPFRHLFEHAGAQVKWFNDTKSVTAIGLPQQIDLKIGSDKALLGGKEVKMETAAFLLHNRTIIPLSFVKESLNVDVEVDTKTGHVLITKHNDK